MNSPESLLPVGQVTFTPREWEIVPLLVRGWSDKRIATGLNVSVRTVEGHVGRILIKLNVANRTEVARWYDTVIHGNQLWQSVYMLRVQGFPHAAIRTATVFSRLLTDEIKQDHPFPTILRMTQGLILIEKSAAYREFLSPGALLIPVTRLFGKIERLAKRCQNDTLLGLAHYTLGDAHYIRKEFDKTLAWLTKAADLVTNPDDRLRILRVHGIASANMGEPRLFARVEQEATRMIEQGDTTNGECICELWEGLARGLGVLWASQPFARKGNDPFDVLDKGWVVYKAILAQNLPDPPYLRGLQLYRTEGILLNTLSPGSKANFLARGGDMVALANRLPYRIKQELPLLLE